MLNPKNYLKILFTMIFFIGFLAAGYVYDFSKDYPPPVTKRISFDAKLKFIRDHIDPDTVDTIIVGSSIGMNNILGSVLEKSSTKVKHALNLSVYEATTLQVEQVLELSDAFPNLKRIIYSAQYSDFPHARQYENCVSISFSLNLNISSKDFLKGALLVIIFSTSSLCSLFKII